MSGESFMPSHSSSDKDLSTDAEQSPTGVEGLDEILSGGLPCYCFYLVQGDPGSGKTTLALQFLLEGLRRGETVFYITLSETKEELLKVAALTAGRLTASICWNCRSLRLSSNRKHGPRCFIHLKWNLPR